MSASQTNPVRLSRAVILGRKLSFFLYFSSFIVPDFFMHSGQVEVVWFSGFYQFAMRTFLGFVVFEIFLQWLTNPLIWLAFFWALNESWLKAFAAASLATVFGLLLLPDVWRSVVALEMFPTSYCCWQASFVLMAAIAAWQTFHSPEDSKPE